MKNRSDHALLDMLFQSKGPQITAQPVLDAVLRNEQCLRAFQPLTDDELRAVIDRTNPRCPFHKRVGQDQVVERLLALLVKALRNPCHTLPGGNALMFTGPPSVGKTDFAKLLCGELGLNLPFVITDAKRVKGTHTLFDLIKATAEEADLPLVLLGTDSGRAKYQSPAICLLIDELHGLSPVVMDALLKAFESKDSLLVTDDAVVDCQHILWIGATTERGSIIHRKPAFDTRFQKIEFSNYPLDQVAQIIRLNYGHWTERESKALAIRSGGIIRIALDMAKVTGQQLDYMSLTDSNVTRMDAIEEIGSQMGIDEQGMSQMQLKVLEALYRKSPKGMTYGQLAQVVARTVDELKEVVLPALLVDTDEHKPHISWSGRTYITLAGAQELLERGVISDEQFENLRDAA